MKSKELKIMVTVAILAAISFILMYLKVPLIPSATFLTYDLSEVVAMIGAFVLGPIPGIFIVIVKAILYFVLGPKDGGWIGALASLVSGLSLVLGTVFFIRKGGKILSKVLAVLVGTLLLTVTMTLLNYFAFLPLYGIPSDQVATMLITAIIPFNIIKGILSSVISIGIYMLIKKQIDKRINK